MKKLLARIWKAMLLVGSFGLAAPALALAADGTTFDVNQVIANTLVGVLIVVIGVLGKLAANALVAFTKKTNSTIDDKILAYAVAWAEDQFGPGKGDEKRAAAARFVVEKTNGKVSYAKAEELVRAAYQHTIGNLSAAKN